LTEPRVSRGPTDASPLLVLFALWLLVFAASSQTMIISPILPQIGDELGVGDALLGTLVTAYSVMVAIFAIISGPISDRIGRRRILLLGTGLMTLALVLHAFVVSYVSFLLVRVVAGIAGGVLSGSAVSYIGDYFPYDRRGWATGWVMSGTAFGQIVGIPLGVLLAGPRGFRAPFLMFACVMALTFLLVFLKVPQPNVRRSTHLSVASAVRNYASMLKKVRVAAASAAYFLMFLGVSLYVVYLFTWLEADFGATTKQIAVLSLFGGIANVLIGPQAGRLSDRIGRKVMILTSCVGLSIVMALTTLVISDMRVAYAFYFVTMVLVAMRISPFSALLTALVADRNRGSLMSLAVAIGQLGLALGGMIAGPLYATYGYASNTFIAAASVLAMGLVVWFFVPEPDGSGSTEAPA